jgi:hypothetical protein
MNFPKVACVNALIIMKILLNISSLILAGFVAQAQEISCYPTYNNCSSSPIIYQMPVVYMTPVVYEAPVIYYAPVYYVSSPPSASYNADCEQEIVAPSTVTVIGGHHSPYSYSSFRNGESSVIRLRGRGFGFH